jgi:hypothetical protein
MSDTDAATLRRQILTRLRSGEKVAAVAADIGVSPSTLYRWKREDARAATKPLGPMRRPARTASAAMPVPRAAPADGELADMTGPGITDKWGVRECLRTRDGRACASRRTEEVGSWLGR